MSIERKREMFLSGLLTADDSISVSVRRDDVKLHPSCAGTVLCEGVLTFVSAVIAQPNSVFVGNYSYMNDGGYVKDRVFIGRYCSIGRRVSIGAGVHPLDRLSTSPFIRGQAADPYTDAELDGLFGGRRPAQSGDTLIGNDVWVGDGAIIVPGVNIGTGAVIGANTVVTKDVLPYQIVAGAPAKVIRSRFSPEIVDALLATQWWNCSLDRLLEGPTNNVVQFLARFKSRYFETCQISTYSIEGRS